MLRHGAEASPTINALPLVQLPRPPVLHHNSNDDFGDSPRDLVLMRLSDDTPKEHEKACDGLGVWPERTTTVMLRNVSSRYTTQDIIEELASKGFAGMFDFLYLPMDFQTKRNRGFCFVNFREDSAARRFAEAFDQQRLKRYPTQKVLEVSPAATQGLDANMARFMRKEAQRVHNPWFRPLIFGPEGEIIKPQQAVEKQGEGQRQCSATSVGGTAAVSP